MTQPGYDALADCYAETFPGPYQSSIEHHAVAAFVDEIKSTGVVVDVGCGLGHVTADLDRRGLKVVGCDPSPAMLAIARKTYPRLAFVEGDATLAAITEPIAAIIARFSLIHIPPREVADILRLWADRLRPTAPVLIASQSSDTPGAAIPFDHSVAPAWRWHPAELSRLLASADFADEWRIINRPNAVHCFPTVHVLARRR
ncbi:MAG: class I SAM-dependent methyltransferase [Actinomycetota bacterium]|nr:class I SAM-dependent methyltransferase [Actinomycetota bacterium]